VKPASPGFCGYVDAGALELYCERHGDGHPLVLLHGAFGGASFAPDGIYPEYTAAFGSFDPHQLDGSRWHEAYRRVAPDPGAWTSLVVKANELDRSGVPSWPRERLEALSARRC
jgi:hypothetical protein